MKYIYTLIGIIFFSPVLSLAQTADMEGTYECSIYNDDEFSHNSKIQISSDGLFYSSIIGLSENEGIINDFGWYVTTGQNRTMGQVVVSYENRKKYFYIDDTQFKIVSTTTDSLGRLTHSVTHVTYTKENQTIGFAADILSHTGKEFTYSAENCSLINE